MMLLYSQRTESVSEEDEYRKVDQGKIYTLLALLSYAKAELEEVDDFTRYLLDMAIVRLSKRVREDAVSQDMNLDNE